MRRLLPPIPASARRVRAAIAVVVVAMVAGVAGCAPAESEGVPADTDALAAFHDQTLEFGECAPDLEGLPAELAPLSECATLEVPLDYDDPGGETLDIGVLRVGALAGEPIGSLVVNPGGPGFAGMGFAAVFSALWAETEVAQRFDVVGFDPRGVGVSEPTLDCYTDEQREDDAMTSALPSGGERWTDESTREVVAQCADRAGGEDALAHIGTRDVARDLDVLRAALGDAQLTFAGSSYGSRLGAVYAEMFPANVRAMTLDAAVDPTKGTAERLAQQNDAAQAAFERMAAYCATLPDCPLGADPARASERSQELLRPLIDTPIMSADGREVTFYKALNGIINTLYLEASWPRAVTAYAQLAQGTADEALALNDEYTGRAPTGVFANSHEATFAINCMDEERLSADETTELLRDLDAAAPAFDPGVEVETLHGCAAWPGEPTLGFPYAHDIPGLAPALVVSVTGDAITPHEGGINLADSLGAALLTVEGNQHGALIAGNPCVDDVVARYLVDLEVPADGSTCTI